MQANCFASTLTTGFELLKVTLGIAVPNGFIVSILAHNNTAINNSLTFFEKVNI